ncbi:hypothetical protein AYO21_11626 [Fonsecaea monophora]|uniref:Uncharacterized protein n=1 Tax=Fonsecaea monophora TaxID=254056 RepID=A0A177ESE2_9EURO|nr:hypothetical protein AYO21_11626 [Fonsecaea monophora]OAG34230.1 hypothetical protein AYO21_11626 [Fonsecaea monophora]
MAQSTSSTQLELTHLEDLKPKYVLGRVRPIDLHIASMKKNLEFHNQVEIYDAYPPGILDGWNEMSRDEFFRYFSRKKSGGSDMTDTEHWIAVYIGHGRPPSQDFVLLRSLQAEHLTPLLRLLSRLYDIQDRFIKHRDPTSCHRDLCWLYGEMQKEYSTALPTIASNLSDLSNGLECLTMVSGFYVHVMNMVALSNTWSPMLQDMIFGPQKALIDAEKTLLKLLKRHVRLKVPQPVNYPQRK